MMRILDFIDKLLHRLFKKILRATRVETSALACFRIFFGVSLLLYFLPSWSWIGSVPQGFYSPKLFSVAYLTDNFLPSPFYIGADILAIILICYITVGFRSRLSLIALFLLSSIFYSYSYSLGKIDHNTSLLLLTYLVLFFSNSGTALAIRKDRVIKAKIQNWSLAVLGIGIAFGFLTAGLPKLMSWIDFDMGRNGFLFWFYNGYLEGGDPTLLRVYVPELPHYFLEVFDYSAVVLEISGFFFLIKGRKWWAFYLIVLCCFHVGNILLLNIDFTINVLCYGIFIISPVLYANYRRNPGFVKNYKRSVIVFVLVVAILKVVFVLLGITTWDLLSKEQVVFLKNIISLSLWAFAIICGILILRRFTANPKKIKSDYSSGP